MMMMISVIASNFGSGASGSRSFSSGNHSNSIVTEEGLTIVVVRGNICNQTVSSKTIAIQSPMMFYVVGQNELVRSVNVQ